MPKPKRLFILDANALLHRAWHALPPLTNPKGQVVNAVYGMMMVVMKLVEAEKPDAFVACWDTEAATFRHDAYAEYKAHREEQPDELYDQIPLVQQGLSALGIESLALDGYEADDLLGTVAARAHAKKWEVIIVTSDRDALQLVRPGISVMAFKKGVTETLIYDDQEVKRQYGLTPVQFLEYKIMRGDPSDNIPGIKGIGEKGATELLQTYGDLKGIFKAVHDPKSNLSASTRAKLLAAEHEIPALRKLVTIVTDAPIKWQPVALQQNNGALQEFLREMGFKSLLNKLTTNATILDTQHSIPDASPSHHLITPTDALRTLEQLHQSSELVLHIARGLPGSLFGQAIEGIIFAPLQAIPSTSYSLYQLPSALILQNAKVHQACQALLNSTNTTFITHDAKQQIKSLAALNLTCERWSFDTMLGAYMLGAGERNHDLPSLAARFANLDLAPDAPPIKQAEATLLVFPRVRDEVQKEGLMPVLERFDLPLVPVLARMEAAGIMIDKPYLTKLDKELATDRAQLEKNMIKLAGRAFNPASPIQLAEVLFTDLNLSTKGIKKGKTGFSTAASELEKLRGQHPLIELIEEYREVSKLLSTYVEVIPLLADKNSRVHTTFNQAVAATGRLSSTDPNLQNIPIRTELGRRIRRAFIAPPNRALISCDYSQIELRLAAALSKDPAMTEAFLHGEDIHRATAAKIWNIPLDKVTHDQRRAAKAINFGILYGQGPHGLAATAGIPFADAKDFIERYFKVYKNFRDYIESTKVLARKLGYVETLFGRRRPIPEIVSAIPAVRAQAERIAVNMPLQGTAADLMKLAMIEVDKQLPTVCVDAHMLLQVHDELVLEAPKNRARDVAAFVKDVMEHVEKVGVPITVETKIGTNWAEME